VAKHRQGCKKGDNPDGKIGKKKGLKRGNYSTTGARKTPFRAPARAVSSPSFLAEISRSCSYDPFLPSTSIEPATFPNWLISNLNREIVCSSAMLAAT
jgi:hypothetical protein